MKLNHLYEVRPGEPDVQQGPSDRSWEKLETLDDVEWPDVSKIVDVRVDHNKLTSLNGCPREVPGKFWANDNQLESLEGGPEKVGIAYHAYNNKLTSLKGAPKYTGSLDVSANELPEIDEVLEHVGGDLDLNDNKLTHLKNIHKKVKFCGGMLKLAGNKIQSNVLGVLLIPGLQSVNMDNAALEHELNQFLPNKNGMQSVIECQDILIAKYKGKFDEFAKL